MKVLVTGATGFVGSNVAKKLIERGYEVNVLARPESNLLNIEDLSVNICYGDLTDYDSLKKAASGCKGLFHVAASYSFWSRNPEKVYNINVGGTKNAIKAALAVGIEKIVYTSSESTIKVGKGKIGREGAINKLSDVAGDYKRSKVLAEIKVRDMCRKGYPVIIVNPTTPIGQRDIKPTPTGRIILDFLLGRMPAYVNTGLNVIDVEDVAMGHVLAFENGRVGQNYLLGNKNLTLKQILETLAKLTKRKAPSTQIPIWLALSAAYFDEFFSGKLLKKPPRIPLPAVQTAKKFRFFDCSKAVNELKIPQSPVEEAFNKSINWFKEKGYVKN